MTTEFLDKDAQKQELALFLKSVFDNLSEDGTQALQQLAKTHHDMERFASYEGYQNALSILGAESSYRQGFMCFTAGIFPDAAQYLGNAAKDFGEHGFADKAKLCGALGAYAEGITELGKKNFAAGLELMQQAESQLGEAGEFAPDFRIMIEHMTPDHLFVGGVMALMSRDFSRGQVLITDAANRLETLAETYHQDDPHDKSFFLGLAKFYRSVFDAIKFWNDFSVFDLEELAQAEDLGRSAREARSLMERADLTNPIRLNCYRLAGTISAVLDTLPLAAQLVLAMLSDKPVPEIDYAGLGKRLKQAADEAAAGGEQNLEMVKMSQQLGATIANLRRYAGERPIQQSHVRLFVMQPFGAEAKIVEEALRAVFEDDPYWFQVILARDQTLAKNLFENVKRHMDLVNAFVADISDLNPNVMIELGMTENDAQERPVLVLRRSDSPQPPPADLKERLYVEYDLPPAGAKDRVQILAAELREKIEAVADLNQLLKHRRGRYLSTPYVRSQLRRARLSLDEDEIKRLQKEFSTVEELGSADIKQIAEKTGFDVGLASSVMQAFKSSAKIPERVAS